MSKTQYNTAPSHQPSRPFSFQKKKKGKLPCEKQVGDVKTRLGEENSVG